MKSNYITSIAFSSLLVLSVLLTSFQNDPPQWGKYPLTGWDKSIIDQANTAKDADYMTNNEKRIVFYTNLCRLQPKKFGESFLDYYYKKNNLYVTTPQFTSLKQELSQMNPINALQPDKDLFKVAHDFAVKMGEEGKTGHEGFQERMKTMMEKYQRVGENCSYGDTGTMDCVVRILIDDADPVHLQHRKNILDPEFTAIGVSIQPHKVFKLNYVMDYAGKKE